MMRTLWYAGLLLLTGFIVVACQSGDLNVGQSVINPQGLLVQPIDTITVQASTVLRVDSFATSSSGALVVGQWTDAQTGQMTAKSFASLNYVSNSLASLTNIQLDSVVLELGVAFTYGDTTNTFALNVHRLTRPLVSERTYYTTSTADYETKPFLQTTIGPQSVTGTPVIRLRFPDALAQSFYSKIVSGEINDETTLANYIPGFAFVTPSTTNCFRGILNSRNSAATGIRLYYHSTEPTSTGTAPASQNILFTTNSVYFTQLSNNRTGTPLSALRSRSDAVSSRLTDNTSFISWGAGLQTRIELPYINQFALPANYAGINSAVLVVSPVRNSLRDNTAPFTTLALYEINSQNEIITAVPGAASGLAAATANYIYDQSQLTLNDTYTFDVTYYMNQLIRGRVPNRPLLLTFSPDPQNGLSLQNLIQRVTLGNQQRPNDQMKVQLYLTSGL
ncbi:DUF4270 domain-containing protein [Spirosoma sp. RP8]|uniref:DUF4270 domain-containing protein n=1 Tax=Spirosoma liriopis TaxID=2937440 RepID=A0ABT0HN49_9BACT|nr:DUF4270 family protein [Spirosoma liriopis]MCK8493297.1 DUF4270 domain-containing protein [Spirosoma liriopis]